MQKNGSSSKVTSGKVCGKQLKRRGAYVCRPPCFPHNLPVTVCGQTKNTPVIHVVRQADQSNQLLVSPLSS